MLETTIKSIADFHTFFIIIIILNIYFKNLIKINIFFLVITLLISNVYFQNFFLKKYSSINNPNTNIVYGNKYDVVILGGNYLKRSEKFLVLTEKIIVDKILFINDKEDVEKNIILKNINKNYTFIYGKSSSTIEDIQIINNNIKKFKNDLIIITDDFHTPRVNKYIKQFDKNVLFFPINNFEDYDKNKIFNINRGVYFLNAIFREILAIVYYNFKGY